LKSRAYAVWPPSRCTAGPTGGCDSRAEPEGVARSSGRPALLALTVFVESGLHTVQACRRRMAQKWRKMIAALRLDRITARHGDRINPPLLAPFVPVIWSICIEVTGRPPPAVSGSCSTLEHHEWSAPSSPGRRACEGRGTQQDGLCLALTSTPRSISLAITGFTSLRSNTITHSEVELMALSATMSNQ
jgi:hypothetical protein